MILLAIKMTKVKLLDPLVLIQHDTKTWSSKELQVLVLKELSYDNLSTDARTGVFA